MTAVRNGVFQARPTDQDLLLSLPDEELVTYGIPPRPELQDPAFPVWKLIATTPCDIGVTSGVPGKYAIQAGVMLLSVIDAEIVT